MYNFNFYMPTKVLFGPGKLNEFIPAKVHKVLGGDITANPLSLSDDDYLTIFENVWR